MQKAYNIFLNALPVVIMIGFIPLVPNDYLLTAIDALVIAALLGARRAPKDGRVFLLGVGVMLFFEYIFVSTGVETFSRQTLLGVMPLWLPIVWGYAFVAIRHSVPLLVSDGR
ncbi:MAG: hypothetical protein KGI60_03310 [Patescibacteria group bacterium]|nr:hypothetical protein [Patescibacteria group bacterium]